MVQATLIPGVPAPAAAAATADGAATAAATADGAATAAATADGAATAAATADGAATAADGAVRAHPEPVVRRLRVDAYELDAALRLERELGVSHALAQILVRRGMADPAGAQAFLDAEPTRPAKPLPGLETALAVIRRAIAAGQRITVHGDYDVDGVCATAISVRALRALGADVDWYIPGRLEDGYGLALATVQRLAERGTRLIITVDCAITAVDEVAAARAAGLGVVVTDHHSPRADGVLPDCPIVHPGLGAYPFPGLCGTAVAHKLAEALGAPTAIEDLELVALATVADLVPLADENRRLVRAGLAQMAVTGRPGLRALLEVSRADPSALDTGTLGFRLAPRINAAGRMRRADAGLELLLTEDHARAREIAAELDAVNLERRAVEQRILWEAEAQVAELGPRPAYVLAGEGWHPGVVGIVASRIVERYHRPTVLIALDGASGTGSGRSIPGFDLLGGLHAGAEHLERYGGHRAAAGLSLAADRVAAFRAAFEAHAAATLTPDLLEPQERVDAIVSGAELGLGLAEELERLEPCGMGNPAPNLLVPGARFADVRPMGEGRHARFSVSSGGTRARAVAFGCDGSVGPDPAAPRDAIFRLERNTYNGAVEPRLVLRHQAPCAPPGITVLGESGSFLDAVLAELSRPADGETAGAPVAARTLVDRRGQSPLAVLADARAAGGPVLAVCADVPRRLSGLAARAGNFALISYQSLARDPAVADSYSQLVALDPPSHAGLHALLASGAGFAHLAWGQPELRFAEQMHELEYGLRTSLVSLYRALRDRRRVAGEELGHLLRGEGPHGRSAALAARLVRILAELELVSLDRDLPALAIAAAAPTALERSPSYRVYAERYEDGRRYLSSANQRRSA
jgi:single-stranded-DNA-specific exonuclease